MSKLPFKEFIRATGPITADGAMATSLYEKGFYINRSFEELCVTDAQSVRDVTKAFKRAGSQIFHTNTFGATHPKLAQHGIQDQLENIILAASEITKQEAEHDGYVVGVIGPLGVLVEPLGPTSVEEAEEYFAKNVAAFVKAGVDAIAIHAIHDFTELRAALEAVKKLSTLPLIVSTGIHENLKTSYGHTLEDLVAIADEYNADVIGLVGEVGPSGMLTAIESLRDLTEKPIMLLPNAGMPRYVNDQYIYLCSPDYMGKFAKRFVQAGANIIGGHCGVYDSHIKAVSNAIKMAGSTQDNPAARQTKLKSVVDQPKTKVSLFERSALGKALAAKEPVISVELVPPTLADFDKFKLKCKELADGGVKFVNIPDGARAMARISSFQLSTYIQAHYNLEAIPHMTCRDRNLIGLQSDLLGAHVQGLRNVLVVTGDPPKLGNNPGATAVYDVDAIGLTHIISRMNSGLDIGGKSAGSRTEFVLGVAVNPTAKNRELEVKRFKYKIEAGADYAITQPIYNLETFNQFMEEVGPVKIPIIMGIWPLVSLRNAEFLRNEVPGVDVPDWVVEEMRLAGDSKEEALKRGMEIAHRTMSEARGLVGGFQVSAPFNKVEVALEVIKGL